MFLSGGACIQVGFQGYRGFKLWFELALRCALSPDPTFRGPGRKVLAKQKSQKFRSAEV